MSTRTVCLFTSLMFVASYGCDSPSALVNPNQPKDLGAPWVNKTDTQMGSSATSSDAAGNRVFSFTNDEFRSVIENIVAEYEAPVAVKPKEMLDWNLTVTVKGKNQEEVLKDLAAACKLTLGKSAGGVPLLTHSAHASGEEAVVKPGESSELNEEE